MTDLSEFSHWNLVNKAEHGDLLPLAALLRSDEKLSKVARDYLADELEKKPKRRFARKHRKNLDVTERDKRVLQLVAWAKAKILAQRFFEANPQLVSLENLDDVELTNLPEYPLEKLWDSVPDEAALNLLSECNDVPIDKDHLDNAKRRTQNWEMRKQRPLVTWF